MSGHHTHSSCQPTAEQKQAEAIANCTIGLCVCGAAVCACLSAPLSLAVADAKSQETCLGASNIYMMLTAGAGLGIYCAYLLTPNVYNVIYDNMHNNTDGANNAGLQCGAVVAQGVVDTLIVPAGMLAGYAVAKATGYVASGVSAKLSNACSYVGSFFSRSESASNAPNMRTPLTSIATTQP